jgi:manganese transport protein
MQALGAELSGPLDSLDGSHRSVRVTSANGIVNGLRRLLAFVGPGYLIAVGYMDPGNWATDLAAGSKHGTALLGVVLVSNLIAMLFQAAAVRLGLAAGVDLAQACRSHFHPAVNAMLWVACEIAIAACNLAEVLGMAIGLNLLFHIPMWIGVLLTIADVFLILGLQKRGFRLIEAVVAALVACVGACFVAQIVWAHPALGELLANARPNVSWIHDPDLVYLGAGIVGATIMPHNLYLHSALVQTRRHDRDVRGTWRAVRCATIDSNVALGLAAFVNAAILIVAASVFNRPDLPPVTELGDAYRLISPLLGVGIASAVFGVALLASGLSASVTGTLAGQVVMEGFVRIKLPPAQRALLTRALSLVPALLATSWYGSEGAGKLLVLSQVILSLQLPFALVPLLLFTTRRRYLGDFAFGRSTAALLWAAALAVIALNMWLLLHAFA